MYLKINGDINKYYLQTICMLFYPGATFSDDEDESASESAEFTRIDEDGAVNVRCTFRSGDEQRTAEKTVKVGDLHGFDEGITTPETKACKVAAGIAALEAGHELFKSQPAWGILTGIRPAKIAHELISARDEEGNRIFTAEAARNVLCREYLVSPKKAALAVEIARSEQKIVRMANEGSHRTCSVYISIPFCPSRCSYCSFVSYSTGRLLSMIPDYLVRVIEDAKRLLRYITDRGFRVLTVYIGGGTPTTLSEEQLSSLLGTVADGIPVKKLHEFTLEGGRPDTLTAGKLSAAKDFGVNRMSINPQTMNDSILRGIGRRHTVDDFMRAYELARLAGIERINTDLIAGLPGDDYRGFSRSLDRIMQLEPENITVHTFCVKKSAEILRLDTEIYKRNAEETVKAVDYSQITLKNAGYHPYYVYRQKNTVGNLENVGYTQKGLEGLYNVLMMEEIHTIFAVGAGAATKLVKDDDNGKKVIERIFEPKYPYEYLAEDKENIEAVFKKADEFFGF